VPNKPVIRKQNALNNKNFQHRGRRTGGYADAFDSITPYHGYEGNKSGNKGH